MRDESSRTPKYEEEDIPFQVVQGFFAAQCKGGRLEMSSSWDQRI